MKMPMKIGFIAQPIDNVLPPNQNSIGIIIYEIARRLATVNSVLVYSRGGGIRKRMRQVDGMFFRSIPIGPDVQFLGLWKRILKLFGTRRPLFASHVYYFAYILQIAFDLRAQGCDVVHVMNFSQFIALIRLFNPWTKIVLHMECEWLTQLDHRMIEKRISKVDLVIGCSEYITQKIRDHFPSIQSRCQTVYNGVDINQFSPREEEAASGKDSIKHLLFVGRGSPEKGVHVLLDALHRIIQEYRDIELEIIGPIGSASIEYIVSVSNDPKVLNLAAHFLGSYASHLQSRVSSGLAMNVTFTGSVPYELLPDRYRNADIFVFPSVWNEPFGMPVIEAMSCGLPIVATRSGGIVELVDDGRTGILVERGEVTELTRAILYLLRDKQLCESMGVAGRLRVSERFTWDQVARELLYLYNNI
jgi:glycosyltransferase involved in cell wall biosynthesis